MPWDNSPAKRAASEATYGPEYRTNRAIARRRARGRCEQCHHLHSRLEADHIVPRSQGGTHHHTNLRMLCKGEGTCKCHDTKTAGEGGGYRKPNDPEPVTRTEW
jgi:5-methylcytosine-specific restriction endonuclease McrA